MTRVFWDTMLFIYLLEDNKEFAPRVRELLDRSYNRGDILLTSYIVLGEIMAGAASDAVKMQSSRRAVENLGFTFLPFDQASVEAFSELRFRHRLKPADAINLACAATGKTDMFLTNDEGILKRRIHIPGIHFIADFNIFVF